MDAYPLDFSEPVAKVRNYIPDTEQLPNPLNPAAPASFLFSDDEIQSFIDDETSNGKLPLTKYRIHRAAAFAMLTIANNQNLILKKLKTQDQATDGPAMAKEFTNAANAMFARAEAEERHAAESLSWSFPPQTDAPDFVIPWWF